MAAAGVLCQLQGALGFSRPRENIGSTSANRGPSCTDVYRRIYRRERFPISTKIRGEDAHIGRRDVVQRVHSLQSLLMRKRVCNTVVAKECPTVTVPVQ